MLIFAITTHIAFDFTIAHITYDSVDTHICGWRFQLIQFSISLTSYWKLMKTETLDLDKGNVLVLSMILILGWPGLIIAIEQGYCNIH